LLTRTACTPPPPLACPPAHTHIAPLPHSRSQPGFYKAGEFGIRIESDLLVVPAVTEYGAGAPAARQWLRFEYTTMVPIALNLLEPALMAEDELAWLDGYHASVREALLPRLALAAAGGDAEDGARARAWLEKATQPVHAPRK
jgi:Xaa-Pro aminopeptidase